MDLRSIINNEAGENSSSKQAAPVTPIQAGPPQQGFREYSHPPQASPGKHPSQDYSGSHHPSGPYASPSSYQGPYSGRPPPPPPILAPPQNDLRSPAGSYSAQSPYRQTPTSSMSGGQYPFPQAHQTPQSPAQHPQYPPSYPRDSYSKSSHPPPHLQHHNSQSQISPAPQTPPIGMPGQPHPYLQHQRSQSSVSTSTPTSAQSQQPYYSQYPQDSPVSTSHFPPSQLPQNQRQQSQPGTPLGPPISQRQSSGGFTHPTSPYQQRGISQGPFANYQTSPAPPPPASIPRLPSTPSGYESQRTSLSEQQRRSRSERERSLSVSPKTRLPSQPPGSLAHIRQQSPYNSSGKRKMEDRENSIEQPQRFEQHDVKPQVNGEHQIPQPVTSSPEQPARKRVRYTEPPIWAQSVKSKSNFSRAGNQASSKINGKQLVSHLQPQSTPSPMVKSEANGHQLVPGAMNRPGPPSDTDEVSQLLGPWEPSIANVKPTDAMAKEVADWLFGNVVSRADIGELTSRGVEVEIEAKLGQLIDKDTGVRYRLPIKTEAVLLPTNRIGFRSSMTENQHKVMNNFLNGKVQETHPQNPGAKQKRVPVAYLHRYEKDEFYELPSSYNTNLPPAVQQTLKARNTFNHAQKLRISRDQKTHQILGKIIKARIADLDILFPDSPLDCRISVNFEMRIDAEIEEIMALVTENRQPDRLKDRMSYTQSHYQIDLTQVTQGVSVNGMIRSEKEHELEIELSTAALRDQGQKAAASQPQKYLALVAGLVDNVRLLVGTVPHQ